jgi:uncharacterized SAM-binding protein YcdF (DUF218 family)
MQYPFDCITDLVFVETEIEKSDIIFIPGGSHPQLVEKAAALYHQGMAPYLLPSGGYNPHLTGYKSEWMFLKNTALQYNVPESAILKEDQAGNTFENADFSRSLLQDRGIVVKKAILVCKAYLSRRALLTYQMVFPDVAFGVAPVADYRGISRDTWFLDRGHTHIVMGEVMKIGKYFEDQVAEWAQYYRQQAGQE